MTDKKTEPRTWLIEGRKRMGLDRREFARICRCSERLIAWLEGGVTITHPNIAARIVRIVGGTVDQYNQLVAQCHQAKAVPMVKKWLGRRRRTHLRG